MLILSIWHHI